MINRRQVARLTETVRDLIPAGGTVAVLGLSYKPNTPVIEESQGIMLAKALREAGIDVIVHDPMAIGLARAVLDKATRFAASGREAVAHADVAVIVTPWSEYDRISPDWVANGRTRFIVDCWHQIDRRH